jgi:hypothetical protein
MELYVIFGLLLGFELIVMTVLVQRYVKSRRPQPTRKGIVETHLGGTPSIETTRYQRGHTPFNTGTSKQTARLAAKGFKTVSMIWDHPAFASLSPIEGRALTKRACGHSLTAVAHALNITPSAVRRAEKRAVDKIITHHERNSREQTPA